MSQPVGAEDKHLPLRRRVAAFLYRERYTCLSAVIAGLLVAVAALAWVRWKLMLIMIGLLIWLLSGCRVNLNDLKELH